MAILVGNKADLIIPTNPNKNKEDNNGGNYFAEVFFFELIEIC